MSSITDNLPQEQCFSGVLPDADTSRRVEAIIKDIHHWPDSWKGEELDLEPGRVILGVFIIYLANLIDRDRTNRTVRKHGDYLWALGGEIIRDLNENLINEVKEPINLLLEYVDSEGGPYWRHANTEEELRQYDSVCRALYKFLSSLPADIQT